MLLFSLSSFYFHEARPEDIQKGPAGSGRDTFWGMTSISIKGIQIKPGRIYYKFPVVTNERSE
jgi:hypothetical protein